MQIQGLPREAAAERLQIYGLPPQAAAECLQIPRVAPQAAAERLQIQGMPGRGREYGLKGCPPTAESSQI